MMATAIPGIVETEIRIDWTIEIPVGIETAISNDATGEAIPEIGRDVKADILDCEFQLVLLLTA